MYNCLQFLPLNVSVVFYRFSTLNVKKNIYRRDSREFVILQFISGAQLTEIFCFIWTRLDFLQFIIEIRIKNKCQFKNKVKMSYIMNYISFVKYK